MNHISIGIASRVYETTSKCVITRHWVDHEGLAHLSRTLRSLSQSLGPEAEEQFWQQTLSPIRRLAFALCSAPLPFGLASAATRTDWDKLKRQVRLCQQTYPDSHAALASLVQKLQALSEEVGTPLSAPLESLHAEYGGISVVLRNTRMNHPVTTYFTGNAMLWNARLVSVRQLRGGHFSDVLVAIGPCAWFPEYVFSAPRASQIHIVSYRWIRDAWKPRPVFPDGSAAAADKTRDHHIGALPQLTHQSEPLNQELPDLQPLDLLPRLRPLGKQGCRLQGDQPGASEETLLARLCHLSGGRGVFVSADEGATSLVIDLSETGDSAVRRVPADELDAELYLLLRTSGGGDYIAALADRILGTAANERRAQQEFWKKRLIAAAQEQFGILSRRELAARVANQLRLQNLSEACTANVQYWMSPKCIHPRKKEDFTAIMAFAGLTSRTPALWEAMGEIHRAHASAGHAIRKMLLQRIATSSLEPLERDGEMAFDLGEQDGGTLSAFQITSVSEEKIEVAADLIGVLLDLEE